MERQHILKILIPFITLALMFVLTEVVSKTVVNDPLLIKISFWSFFVFGFAVYWIIVKLGIN
jgi:hypothetical protein